jgi:hypothetical protein
MYHLKKRYAGQIILRPRRKFGLLDGFQKGDFSYLRSSKSPIKMVAAMLLTNNFVLNLQVRIEIIPKLTVGGIARKDTNV